MESGTNAARLVLFFGGQFGDTVKSRRRFARVMGFEDGRSIAQLSKLTVCEVTNRILLPSLGAKDVDNRTAHTATNSNRRRVLFLVSDPSRHELCEVGTFVPPSHFRFSAMGIERALSRTARS